MARARKSASRANPRASRSQRAPKLSLVEQHLGYVDNALHRAQLHQQKLWKELNARRGRGNILPLHQPIMDDFIAAARMTASLMIDIETVRDEYAAEKAGRTRRQPAWPKLVLRAGRPRRADS